MRAAARARGRRDRAGRAQASARKPSAFRRRPPITRSRAIVARSAAESSAPSGAIARPRRGAWKRWRPRYPTMLGAKSTEAIRPRCCVVGELSSCAPLGSRPTSAHHSSAPLLASLLRCRMSTSSLAGRAATIERSASRPPVPRGRSATTSPWRRASAATRAGSDAALPSEALATRPASSAAAAASGVAAAVSPAYAAPPGITPPRSPGVSSCGAACARRTAAPQPLIGAAVPARESASGCGSGVG